MDSKFGNQYLSVKRYLVTNVSNPKAKEKVEALYDIGMVFTCDSRVTQDHFRNFIKFNLNNFEATLLALRIANPEEIHHFVDNSYLKSIHLLLAANRCRKIIFYFSDPSEYLDNIAKLSAKEFGYIYESKFLGNK